MQIDEVVWQIINRQNCSFKVPTDTQTFCRNEYNVTGMCKRSSCPLANSQYATIMQDQGVCYLYIKTIERSHLPKDMWEKIKIRQKLLEEQIDEQLAYWPKFLIHKNKQRLTKLRQMLIRIRKLKLKGYKEVVPVKQKIERREKVREQKAVLAANIDEQIEKELLDRLQSGVYEDLYANLNPKAFNKVMDDQEIQEEEEEYEEDLDELDSAEYIQNINEDDGEDDDEDDEFGNYDGEDDDQQYSEESEEDDNDDKVNAKRKGKQISEDEESEDEEPQENFKSKGSKLNKKGNNKKVKPNKKGRKKINIEYENEHNQQQQETNLNIDF